MKQVRYLQLFVVSTVGILLLFLAYNPDVYSYQSIKLGKSEVQNLTNVEDVEAARVNITSTDTKIEDDFEQNEDMAKKWKSGRKNVILIISDDMRPNIGAYKDVMPEEDAVVKTPVLDNLARRSLLLKNAHVQMSLSNPSRTSFLTGRRPDTTHVYNLNTYFRKTGGDFVTIPQYFKENGYQTVGVGKIFHCDWKASGVNQDMPKSWNVMNGIFPDQRFNPQNSAYGNYTRATVKKLGREGDDMEINIAALHHLGELSKLWKETGQNFVLAVGYRRPHLPFLVPEKFAEIYPVEDVPLSKHRYAPFDMPPVAWLPSPELKRYMNFKNHTVSPTSQLPWREQRELRRHYFASISWVDSLIGKLLANLHAHKDVEQSTIVAFLGDHGWHLGEHALWCKMTNFDSATHAPMMIAIPGLTDKGINVTMPTEFVDLFPTLADAAGLPPIELCPVDSARIKLCTEGRSLLPLVKNPTQPNRKNIAFSQTPRSFNIMGYTLRTPRYRYTEWIRLCHDIKCPNSTKYVKYWDENLGRELYDHHFDHGENVNLMGFKPYKEVVEFLSRILRIGWRKAVHLAEEVNQLKPRENQDVIKSHIENIISEMLLNTHKTAK